MKKKKKNLITDDDVMDFILVCAWLAKLNLMPRELGDRIMSIWADAFRTAGIIKKK